MEVIAIDAGAYRNMGVLSHPDGSYKMYWEHEVAEVINRIRAAKVVITFNGDRYDLTPRAHFPELSELPESVASLDMRDLAWRTNQSFFGRNLATIYLVVFGTLPTDDTCPTDPYLANNWLDCRMALDLWLRYSEGSLRPILTPKS